MAKLTFKSTTFDLNTYESVLDCLLRNKQYIPYACRAGMCQACLIKAVNCEATPDSKKWIKDSLQQRGYTLACQWVPDNDVEAALPSVEEFSVKTRIRSIDPLNNQVLRLILEVVDEGAMFHYFPGQFITLINPDGIARSYSTANSFEQDRSLEFHISSTSSGVFTGWLFQRAKKSDILYVRRPSGDCYYSNAGDAGFPIILAGIGTGLAPLYAIINDALNQNHLGDISLYHGGRTTDHLYYIKELEALQSQHNQFHYYPCVREKSGKTSVKGLNSGTVEQLIDSKVDTGALSRSKIFLCGAPDFVHGLRKQVFLKGASSGNIYCDPFLEHSIAPTGGTK